MTAAEATSGVVQRGERAARAARAVERHAAAFEPLAGAAVGVVWDGELVVARCWGVADAETGRAVTAETNFRLASVTKQFTAAAVLMLVEEGKVGLDERLDAFFVDLPGWARSVTVRQLLTHTSGLPDYEDLIPEGTTLQIQNRQVLHLVMDADEPGLLFEPGSRFKYSNTGYALLSEIVEVRSGVSFARFMRERFFEPLGMRGSRVQERGVTEIQHRAYGHTKRPDGALERTDQSLTSAVIGDGAIYSSIVDLARWDAALRDPPPEFGLSGEMIERAMTAQVEDPAKASDYGFGWRIGRTGHEGAERPRRRIWHTGETRGFRTLIDRYETGSGPRAGGGSNESRVGAGRAGIEGVTVILLMNQENGTPDRLAISEAIAAELLGVP